MNRVLIYIAFAAVVLAAVLTVGCSISELPQPDISGGYTPSDSPISFKTEDNWSDESDKTITKGTIVTSSNFVSFTAFAYYMPSIDGGVAEWNDNATPDFMYNQLVSREKLVGDAFKDWSYTPTKYWSNNPNDRIMFFACAPHNSEGVELSNNTDSGAPKFTVEPHRRPYYHQDFMTAEAHLKGKDDGEVKFHFKHKLAQAKIYVAHKGNDKDEVKVLGITVKGMRKRGYLVYDEGKNEYVWEHQQPEYSEAVPTTMTYNFVAAEEHPNELRMGSAANVKCLNAISTTISDYTDPSLEGGKAHMFLVPENKIEEIEFILFFDYYKAATGKRIQSFQKFVLYDSSLIEGETKAYLLLIDPVSIGYGEIITTAEPWHDIPITDNDSGNDWVIE